MRWLHRLLAIAIASTAMGALAADSADKSQSLRLMSYNIRLDLASDGANAWAHRQRWVTAQIAWLRPDIFGLQEVLPNQKADLATELPQYRIFGDGRDGKGAGEASPIGYHKQRFEFLDGGMFWLSPTPDRPSKGWDAAYPRIVTWARLKVRGARQVVLAVNTHWDHIGLEARRRSAEQMLRWLDTNARRCEAVLVLGDFNSELDSEQMRAMLQSPLALRDARGITKSPPFGPGGTFNGFATAPLGAYAIDHVLVGAGVDVERYAVFTQVIEGRVPSDHFPVLVDISVARCR
jgi:endonuclease/exonuclease/phosphatase family metal-dependent hydrolase